MIQNDNWDTRRIGTLLVMALSCTLPATQCRGQAEDEPSPASQPDPQVVEEPDTLSMDNPSSIAEQVRRDRVLKDHLFQFPGANKVFDPWYKARTKLDEKYGFKPGFSFTHLYQKASDTVGPEDDASGFELVVDGTWDLWGRGTDSPTTAGFEFLYRDRLQTDLPPVALFTQVGSLYPTSVAFAEIGPTVGQLWLQHKFSNKFGIKVGRHFPVSAYDFFPLKNFRTDFVDGIHAANLIIPLPDRGLGGFAMYRPRPDVYLRLGVHDANADPERMGFDTMFDEGELFTIFEAGFDPGFMERVPGRPPFGDVHVTFWHQDERENANVDDGWGAVVSGSQRFGRFLPFLRYGYSDSGPAGPSSMEHMVNGGVAINNIFGQSNDRIGIGLTWAHPSNDAFDDQEALDVYYRIQVTPELAVSPMMQVIFDPVRNPDEDQVVVLGIRTRLAF